MTDISVGTVLHLWSVATRRRRRFSPGTRISTTLLLDLGRGPTGATGSHGLSIYPQAL